MNFQETGRFISGLLRDKPSTLKHDSNASQAQKKDVLFTAKEVYGIDRRQFLAALGLVGIGAVAVACAPGLPTRVVTSPTPTRVPFSSKEVGFLLEAGEVGQTLNYGEALSIGGQIEFRNESRLVNLIVAMSRIDAQTGTEAGLLQLQAPLLVRFVDKPSDTNITGGETIFDPQTGRAVSEIAVPFFVNRLVQEAKLPKTSLTTRGRERGYLSILLSQATLVEMSNQAHLQQYTGQQPSQMIGEQIDKASNQLGVKYSQQIIAEKSKPFIIVNNIN